MKILLIIKAVEYYCYLYIYYIFLLFNCFNYK